MNSMNRVQLVGNIGRDPEIRTTQTGMRIASFTVATSERWKPKGSTEWKEVTTWHTVVTFVERYVEMTEEHLKKGSKVFVEGQITNRKWTGQDGKEHYATEIAVKPYSGNIMLLEDTRSKNGGGRAPSRRNARSDQDDFGGHDDFDRPRRGGGTGGGPSDIDDDIPF